MSGHGFRLALILPVLGLIAAPAQAQFCFVDHVARKDPGIELYFVPGSNVFVRISQQGQGVALTDRMYQQLGDQMHRSWPNAQHPDAEASQVVILPGEEAFVSNGLHSSCIVLPAGARDPAGVTMKASVSLPGLPPTTTMRFLPVEALQDTGR